MKLSTRARYGLRLIFNIGIATDKISLPTLIKQTDLSEKYAEQLLGMLRKAGIVESVRGAGGGYYLSRPSSEITIKEILVALDDSFEITDCVSGKCQDNYCPNKIIFKRLYDGIDGLLSSTTLADMINDYRCV
ncbi:MAG: Rrf2 family transcriptional regulator [Clostridia bacterium]|nr:Rrf2 family transcriptional regulator [Clostridia bacterium]MBR6773034.1 Rrf2 family transcriptional regulator [Clostridia bacterium]MBR7141805.1 Rrf2 family transcriptional regulator [Clostridia bacterium]